MRRTPNRMMVYVALASVATLFVAPLLYMLSMSLKTPAEIAAPRPTLLPQRLFDGQTTISEHLSNYREILGAPSAAVRTDDPAARLEAHFDFLRYARNTLIIAALSLVGVLASCSIAAYGFARIRFPGRDAMFALCLATMMIPSAVLMVPSYMLFKQLGWIGTFLPLWVPAWFGSAFNIFLLRQFFMGIPRELEESAMIDGCSTFGCFWRIMLPLARPALAVVALFHVLFVWNDLVGPLIYLSHQDDYTLALGLSALQSRSGDTPWNQLMAASTLIVLPVIALFILAQRTFVQGVATSGIKG